MLAAMQRLLMAATTSSSSSMHRAAAVGSPQLLQRCCISSSPGSSAEQQAQRQRQPKVQELMPEQQQHLNALQYLVRRPLEAAHSAALLTALTAGYRDLYVVMDQLHKRDILGVPRPLVDEPPAAASSCSSNEQQQPVINHTQMFYPVRDFTKLPDEQPPAGGWLRSHLEERYMTRITAYAQLLPNHLEVSYQTGAQIFLWPPMEAYMPGVFDFEGMLRYLRPGQKMKRTKRSVKAKRSRCRLGFQRTTPYHKPRVV